MQFFKTLSIVSRSSARPLGNSDLSLHSKRFRLVSEQRNSEEGDFPFWPREKWNESQKVKEGEVEGKEGNFLTLPRSFTCATFLAVFDSRSSFFSPKPHGNACYAGYSHLRLAFLFFFFRQKNNISNKKTSVYIRLCFQENIKTRLCASWKKLV